MASANPCCSPCLTQVLAGESSGDDLRFGERTQLSNITDDRHPVKVVREDSLRRRIDFTQEIAVVPGQAEAPLDAPYTGEETDNAFHRRSPSVETLTSGPYRRRVDAVNDIWGRIREDTPMFGLVT